MSLLYILYAAIALGILVFVHELGHLIAARLVGMRVDAFSIGFGRPLFKWSWKNIQWQLGWLPFGGYVKIAGMEISKQKDKRDKNGQKDSGDPYTMPEGFFGKAPWKRIVVALAGPIANFILALILFTILFLMGGREKPFAEFTKIVGWVDPSSELYIQGLRPGDEILTVNGSPYTGSKDLLYAAMLGSREVTIEGNHLNYATKEKIPFSYRIETYQSPGAPEGVLTTGVLAGARYLIYDRVGESSNPLIEGSPMSPSGIEYQDRIVWADGVTLFSMEELSHLLNDERVLLTVKRGNRYFLTRQPRPFTTDLALPGTVKNELIDWAYEVGIKGRWQRLRTLPYNLNAQAVVEGRLSFIDEEAKNSAFPNKPFLAELESPLEEGDQIVAVSGNPIETSYQLLNYLQMRQVLLIVEKGVPTHSDISWNDADNIFMENTEVASIENIAHSIGTPQQISAQGRYTLLRPVEPKKMGELTLSHASKVQLEQELNKQKSKIASMKSEEARSRALRNLEQTKQKYLLGIFLQDETIHFNPQPVVLFAHVFGETGQTLKALVFGYLSPKWLSGPVGIVQVIHHGWSVGIGEALFWIAAISINLGILNLLPIPVLDGGYIALSLWEMITRRQVKAKTLERLVIPFVLLLIILLIFLTFQDITRLF